MGQNVSMDIFHIFNNIHVTLGSGILGIYIFIRLGMKTNYFKTMSITALTASSIRYVCFSRKLVEISHNKVIFVTGCDSGLGFSLALHACELGFTVFAGCLNVSSDGAKELSNRWKKVNLIELDITKIESVENTIKQLRNYLNDNKNSVLWALVNNAGVMVFGEFEWQTERLIEQQLEVNLFGTMRITKYFLPMLRQYSGRIITIGSHCAHATLPGLSAYGATKAGLSAWSDGLRVELTKYGVKVISFIPGSFIQQSNIMSRQNENVYEMQSAMSQEQILFYGNYFRQYNSYLSVLSGVRSPKKICDDKLYKVYERALLEDEPSSCYVHEPWKYTLYHTLFKISPVKLRDYLIVKFVQMPQWNRGKSLGRIADVIA